MSRLSIIRHSRHQEYMGKSKLSDNQEDIITYVFELYKLKTVIQITINKRKKATAIKLTIITKGISIIIK